MAAKSKRSRKSETVVDVIRSITSGGDASNERLLHDRIRLALVSALAVNRVLSFVELRGIIETSDGNLSVHARKLEDAGHIKCVKTFKGRTPRTEFQLLARGRKALEAYLSHMESLVRAVRKK